ncbi:hypothetical protein GCM10027275_03140 [Rhabdobacter roseus]|uniref:DUF192 domain-containing protein n=1 Tax=Rhabdobacter roseus TaxID=1655419 RepID=A0A840TKW5_9BACT|nr:DUF192 domain-containing protein [Rhabdobacter roseus]MBB5282202.1 hypothetical protein [Rhabdobacter roseus]
MRNRTTSIARILLGILVLAGLAYVAYPLLTDRPKSRPEPAVSTGTSGAESSSTPVFTKEGEVTFVSAGKKILTIDVEIAENEAERAKGLMYRPYLPDSVGMLFVFERADPHSFWMKNTAMPLDIIYVGADKKIISIQKNTTPYSEQSLPSFGDAQYVVEVNAGFTDRQGIKVGDSILF